MEIKRVGSQPSAKGSSDWHPHPLGQTLIVTSGCGWAPGEKHWHGDTPKTAMTHIAIQESLNGKVVEWMEHATDQQYRK